VVLRAMDAVRSCPYLQVFVQKRAAEQEAASSFV
jgi:hypothetical protein